MSVMQAVHRFCGVENEDIPLAVRRRELAELAAIVIVALVVQAVAQLADRGPAWIWVSGGLQLALPFGAAWTLRRSAGNRALAAAGILVAGLIGALLISAVSAPAAHLTSQAYVAAAMVWVLSSNPRTSTRAALAGAAILAIAFVVAAFI